jgi:hypothetical protein
MKFRIVIAFLLMFNSAHAQEDFSWWNTIHNWDGHTSWNQYMTMSSSFMGPNALPVPENTKGRIDSSAELEIAVSYHFSKGDKTTDFFLRGYLPMYDNRVAVAIDVVPYEWFKTDTVTRDIRAARTKNGKGGAGGDIYFNTEFQIIRNRVSFPDLSFRATYRIASGTNLRNARHTDAPGYFFDLSSGKNIGIKNNFLRIYVMAGFYAYQTYELQHLQNDCFLYGGGVDFISTKIILSQSVGGYNGYLDIGDKPLVYRASLRLKQKHIDWKVSYQKGIRDFDFERFRLSLIWHMDSFIK